MRDPDPTAPPTAAPPFLAEGGETGRLLRERDWAGSPLGPPEAWPDALRTVVGIALGSRQPMLIVWGPEQTTLYNDGYAAMCGARHPAALGRPFRELWFDIWDQVEPILARAYAGDSTHADDIAFVMHRNGYPEETHFAFSYTPVRDASGTVQGMFCACTETTATVIAERKRVEDSERLRALFLQAPGFMAILRGPDLRFELANEAFLALVGERDVVGRTLVEALPELAPQDLVADLRAVYETGEAFKGSCVRIRLQREPGALPEDRALEVVFQAIRDAEGTVDGIFVEGSDVTNQLQAERDLRDANARLEAEAMERSAILGQLAEGVIVTDRTGRITFVNEAAALIHGVHRLDVAPGEYAAAYSLLTEAGDPHPPDQLPLARAVLHGETVLDARWRIRRPDGREVTAIGGARPISDAAGIQRGAVLSLRDDTARLAVEQALVASEAELRLITDALPLLISFVDRDHVFRFANRYYKTWFDTPVADIVGRHVRDTVGGQVYASRLPYLERALAGEHVTFDADMPRRDGLRRECEVQYIPRLRAGGRIDGVYILVIDISARKRAEERLRQLNETLESRVAQRTLERDRVWRNSRDLLVVVDWSGTFQAVSPSWTEILGYAPEEVVGRSYIDFVHPDDAAFTRAALKNATRDSLRNFENRYVHRDGTPRWISWVTSPEGEFVYGYGRHISAEKEQAETLRVMEEQLRQSQKMEAVGQLTGGIAHDFNNLLTGIIGSLDLLQRRLAQGRTDSLGRYAEAATSSANRAAALTHRLLAFSRRQPLDAKPTDVNALVTSLEELLRRTMGEQTAIEIAAASDLWLTLCDPNQLENAVLNLAINARDAMPDGGTLTIETGNAHLDHAYTLRHPGVAPGGYVSVSVSDNGTGMPPEVVARVFDPFFTTKPLGQGTGLGLSMVWGFARQSDGHIAVYSEPGLGTTVKIYLPRFAGEAESTDRAGGSEAGTPRAEAGETVLVVEDEAVVRDLIVEVLHDLGYRALEAADGTSGLRIVETDARIDLLVTDVGLPGLNGRQLADRARALRPGLKVLFMTGYAENAMFGSGLLDPGVQMITKPFPVDALAVRIRGMIEQ